MDKIREFFFPKPKPVVVVVEKEKPKRMSWNRALLTTEGAVGVGQGLSMLVSPGKAQVSSVLRLCWAGNDRMHSCSRCPTIRIFSVCKCAGQRVNGICHPQ